VSSVFFIADTHFGHRNILKYRPCFKSVEEHDETIISNWNRVVTKKKYVVWVLGDMCIKNKEYDMDNLIYRLNGNIRIITGNHDHIKYYPQSMIWNGIWSKYDYWLSHAPLHPNELRGKRNIHGHVHNKTIDDNRYINVCCDVINYTPISLDEIRNKQ